MRKKVFLIMAVLGAVFLSYGCRQKTETAKFKVTVTQPENGKIEVTPPLPADNMVDKGAELTFKLSANSGHKVKELNIGGTKYSAAASDKSITQKVKIEKDIEVSAITEAESVTPPPTAKVKVTVTQPANGKIEVTPPLPADNMVDKGAELTFKLSANSGHKVKELNIGGTKYSAAASDKSITQKVKIEKNTEVSAITEAESVTPQPVTKFKVAMTCGAEGKISANPDLPADGMVKKDSIITFNAEVLEPSINTIDKWTVTGGEKTAGGLDGGASVSVKITANTEVNVTFKRRPAPVNKFKVTITQPANGKIEVTPPLPADNMVDKDAKLTFVLSANSGFFVDNLSVGGHLYKKVETNGTIKAENIPVVKDLEIKGVVSAPVLKEIRFNYAEGKTEKITDFTAACPAVKTLKEELNVFIKTVPNNAPVTAAGLTHIKDNPDERMYKWTLTGKNNQVSISTCGVTYTLNAERYIEIGDVFINLQKLDKNAAAAAAKDSTAEAPTFELSEAQCLVLIGEHPEFKKEYDNVTIAYTIGGNSVNQKFGYADKNYTHTVNNLPANTPVEVLLTASDSKLAGCDLQYKFKLLYKTQPPQPPTTADNVKIGEIFVSKGSEEKAQAVKAVRDASDPKVFTVEFPTPDKYRIPVKIWFVGENNESKQATVTKYNKPIPERKASGNEVDFIKDYFYKAGTADIQFTVKNGTSEETYTLKVTYK